MINMTLVIISVRQKNSFPNKCQRISMHYFKESEYDQEMPQSHTQRLIYSIYNRICFNMFYSLEHHLILLTYSANYNRRIFITLSEISNDIFQKKKKDDFGDDRYHEKGSQIKYAYILII